MLAEKLRVILVEPRQAELVWLWVKSSEDRNQQPEQRTTSQICLVNGCPNIQGGVICLFFCPIGSPVKTRTVLWPSLIENLQ